MNEIDDKTRTRSKSISVDLNLKYLLTIKETAALFNIGEQRLYRILEKNPALCLTVGVKRLVRRERFEKWLDETDCI